MALRINFNYQAAASHTALVNTERAMNKSLLRLSTGYRILSAADDAAGLFIADQLALVGSALEQGNRNIQTGISALQIAEGGISQIYDKLKTMYTKAQSAANDINDPNARSALQADIRNLIDAIQKVATDTEYNGIKLLDGTFKNKVIHYGARSEQTISVNISSVKATDLGAYLVFGKGKTISTAGSTDLSSASGNFLVTANTEYVKVEGITVLSYGGSGKELIDAATVADNINSNSTLRDLGITAYAKNVSKADTTFGTITVESTSGSTTDVNLVLRFFVGNKDVTGSPDFTLTYTAQAGGSSITITLDQIVTDINTEASANGVSITARAEDGRLVLETENGETIAIDVSLTGTLGTNNNTSVDLSKLIKGATGTVDRTNTDGYAVKVGELTILGETSYTIDYNGVDDFVFQDVSGNAITSGSTASLFNLYSIDVTDNEGAELAMKVIDVAIKRVDSLRADVGSIMLNLQAIQDYQKVAQDNTNEAENVIRNVDFAKEMIEFTKQQVRMQASMAMLAQANALPQLVLQLLR